MQKFSPSLLIEIGAAATVGAGFVALRANMRGKQTVAPEAKHLTLFGKSCFNKCVESLRALRQPDRLQEFVHTAEDFLICVDRYNKSEIGGHAQFVANRHAHHMNTVVQVMIEISKKSRDPDLIDAAVVCETEEAPSIRSMSSNILHNMLLDR